MPYNLQKDFGPDTQVINFPLAYFGVNIIIKPQAYPANFGRKIRAWFVQNSQLLTNRAIQWENHLPAYYWVDVSFTKSRAMTLWWQKYAINMFAPVITMPTLWS